MELDKLRQLELDTTTHNDIKQLLHLREEIDELAEKFEAAADGTPRVDLLELDDAFRVIAEVPGVQQDELEIALQGHMLTVAGVREDYDQQDKLKLVLHERPSGHFQRTIELPSEVDYESSSAHVQSGLLIIHLPKRS